MSASFYKFYLLEDYQFSSKVITQNVAHFLCCFCLDRLEKAFKFITRIDGPVLTTLISKSRLRTFTTATDIYIATFKFIFLLRVVIYVAALMNG